MTGSSVKRIAIFGVPGHNRGDDAICRSLLEGFALAAPGTLFSVAIRQTCSIVATPYIETFIVNRRSVRGIIKIISVLWNSDAIVIGGGSVVQDQFGGGRLRGILGYVWFVAALGRLMQKPIVSAPIGVDELTSRSGRVAATEFLRMLDKIYVRDEKSGEIVKSLLGVRESSSLKVVCDPAFALMPTRADPPGERYYVLAPAFESGHVDKITNVFRAVTEKLLLSDPGARVTLLAMDVRQEEDHGNIEKIIGRLPEELRGRVGTRTPDSPEEAAEILRGAAGIVAMRLHALILGFGFAPLYCISRTTKTAAFMQKLDVAGTDLFDARGAEVIAKEAFEQIGSAYHLERNRKIRPVLTDQLILYYQEVLAYLKESK